MKKTIKILAVIFIFFLFLSHVRITNAAFSGYVSQKSAVEETSDTSIAATTFTGNMTVGQVVFVSATTDNIQTADGASTLHTITDTDSNIWIKVFEETETDGAAGDGSTVSLWWTKVQTQIDTTDTITLTTSSAVTAKVLTVMSATIGAGNTLASTTGYTATTHYAAAGSNPSRALTGLTSREYFEVGFGGAEGTDQAKTPTNLTERYDLRSGTSATTSVSSHVATRIQTATGDTWTSSAWTYTSAIQSLTMFYEIANPTAALSGTITSSTLESDIVSGGKTIILTLTNAKWIATAGFNAQRQGIINGLDSAQSEAAGWDAVVKATQGVSGVVRTSDTVVTITLDAFASYSVTANETITATIPYGALENAMGIGATPTFTVTNTNVISGHVYAAEPSTAFNCSTNNLTISISINGAAPTTTTCTNSSGDWSKSISLASSDIINVWVSGQASGTIYAETVYVSDGTNKTDINMWQSTLAVRHDTGTSVTRANLATGLYVTKGQQLYAFSGANLTIDSAIEFHVYSGKTFDSTGGTFTTQGSNTGDLHIDTSGVMSISTGTSVIAGDVDVDGTLNLDASVNFGGATFVSAGTTAATAGTHTFTTTTTVSGGGTINFYDLATSGTGTLTLSSAVSTDNNVTIGSGTTLQNNATLTVGGDGAVAGKLTIAATLNINGGALTTSGTGVSGVSINYSGTPTTTIDTTGNLGGGTGTIAFYNLNTTGATTTTVATNNIVIDNGLSVGASHVFAMGTNSLTIGSTSISDSGDITMATGASTTHTSGTVTVLGNSGNAADWAGPGEFDVANLVIGNDSTTFTVDNVTNDLPLDIAGNFTLNNAATFQAASTTTKFQIGGDWVVDATSAVFTSGDGTVTLDSTSGSPTITSGGDPFYNLSIDNAGTAIAWELQDALDVNGNLLIDTSNTLDAKTGVNNNVNVAGNWTNNGTYTARSNTTTLDGAADTTQIIDGNTTFYNLTATTGDRILNFGSSDTFTIASGGTFTATGGSCTALIGLRSTLKGTAVNITKTGSITFSYIDAQDINVESAGGTVGHSVDSGNNTNLDFSTNRDCISASTDATAIATGQSFQRKTFFDNVNQQYWVFVHDGDEIEVRYSTDGTIWNNPATEASGHIAYDTNDFSLWWKQIGTIEYVWLAVRSGDDIVVRRGELSTTDITWDTDEITALGTGTANIYSYPYFSLDSNNYMWVMARNQISLNYVMKAVRSDVNDTGDATWDTGIGFGTTVVEAQLSDDQSDQNVFGSITSLASQDMYAAFTVNTAIEGCVWDSSDSAWENSDGTASCSMIAGGIGDTEGSSIRSSAGAAKIDDIGNPGSMSAAGRQIIQTSGGTLYAFINTAGSCGIWKSSTGASWVEQDTNDNPACNTLENIAMAIDNLDILHLIYEDDASEIVKYITYKTVDYTADPDQFGTEESVTSFDASNHVAIAIDTNNIPHVVAQTTITNPGMEYSNRVGGSWDSTPIVLEQAASLSLSDVSIIISEDNIPEISYLNATDGDLTAAVGNQNDASSFTLHDVDPTVDTSAAQKITIGIDAEGNTWIGYIEVTSGNITLVKHNDADTWITWQTPVDSGIVGQYPSISVSGKSIFVLYVGGADEDVKYNIYDYGTADWLGETNLATGTFFDVKVRYSKYNFHEPWLMDYLYSDGTDIYWNYVDLRATKIDDASDFGALTGAGRQILRTNSGSYYAIVYDPSTDVEVWKSSDGFSWEEQNSAASPNCSNSGCIEVAATIRSTGVIDILFIDVTETTGFDYDLEHITFNTSNDTFGTQTNIRNPAVGTGIGNLAVSMDASDKAHIVWKEGSNLYYSNNVGGTFKSPVTVESISLSSIDLTIDMDGKPQVAYINSTDDDLTVRRGDANNATEFTTDVLDVDSDVSDISNQKGVSISVDTSTGNTWVAYIDDTGEDNSGSNDAVALAKHAYGVSWATWSTVTTKTDVGYEPSITIAGSSDIYVFYQEDSTDQKIVYDVYNSATDSPAWAGETTLQTRGGVDLKDVKTKWSFEWNNFGVNRIDYLFSDGTDVYWDYLYVRRSPTNIDNASDFGAQNGSGRQVLRTSSGVLYTIINRLDINIEVWKSSDNGNSWSKQDSADGPTTLSAAEVSAAIDSSDVIHIAYNYFDGLTDNDTKYITFTTSNDQFTTAEDIDTSSNPVSGVALAIDSSDIPHVVYRDATQLSYTNRIGGSWTIILVENITTANALDITINDENIPEISYINSTDDDLTAAIGNDNDATSFGTPYDVDATVNDIAATRGTSISIDSSGNTWIAYVDASTNYVTLAKHADAAGWTTWTTVDGDATFDNNNLGSEPSIVINGTDVHVFYEDDQNDIVFDKYNGSAWSGETLIEEHGALQDAKVRWSFLNNFSNNTYGIDYLYSDGTDVFYNRYSLGDSTPGTQDTIGTTTNGTAYNLSLLSDESSPNDVHILYLDNSSTKKVVYNRWDNNGASSAWQTPVTIDETGSSVNRNAVLTLDSTTKDLYASWIDQTGDDHIYSKQCDVTSTSDECSTGAKWGTRTSKSTAAGAVYVSLTANYSAAGKVLGMWTNTATTPFAVAWSKLFESVGGNTAPSAPTSLYVNERVNGAATGKTNPIAVGDSTPVFSSQYADSDAGDIANKYQVVAYSDSGCTTQVWDSGATGTAMTNCTQGNRCTDVTYGGNALEMDGSTYYWKTRYWDDDNAAGTFSSCSDSYTMLGPGDQMKHGNYFFNAETENVYTW